MPDFIVLHTTSPAGTQNQWDELGVLPAEDAPSAFETATKGALGPGQYKVLPLTDEFTVEVEMTVTTSNAKTTEG